MMSSWLNRLRKRKYKLGDGGDGLSVRLDDTREYREGGVLHREDGPAVETTDGRQSWWKHGQRHREDGPAFTRLDGSKEWRFQGQLHREVGPAVEQTDGRREWWHHGKLHRELGPAVEAIDGSRSYWLRGREVGQEVIQGNINAYRLVGVKLETPEKVSF